MSVDVFLCEQDLIRHSEASDVLGLVDVTCTTSILGKPCDSTVVMQNLRTTAN